MRFLNVLRQSWIATLVTWSIVLIPSVSAQPIQADATASTWSNLLDSIVLAQEGAEPPDSVVWLSAKRLVPDDRAAVERWKQGAGVIDIQRLASESKSGKAASRQVEARWKQWARRVGWTSSEKGREQLILEGEQDIRSLDVELRQECMKNLVPVIEAVAAEDCSVLLMAVAPWDTFGLVDNTDAVLRQLDR